MACALRRCGVTDSGISNVFWRRYFNGFCFYCSDRINSFILGNYCIEKISKESDRMITSQVLKLT
jgi:hypothetical protein